MNDSSHATQVAPLAPSLFAKFLAVCDGAPTPFWILFGVITIVVGAQFTLTVANIATCLYLGGDLLALLKETFTTAFLPPLLLSFATLVPCFMMTERLGQKRKEKKAVTQTPSS